MSLDISDFPVPDGYHANPLFPPRSDVDHDFVKLLHYEIMEWTYGELLGNIEHLLDTDSHPAYQNLLRSEGSRYAKNRATMEARCLDLVRKIRREGKWDEWEAWSAPQMPDDDWYP